MLAVQRAVLHTRQRESTVQVQIDELRTRLQRRTGCAQRDIQVIYVPLRISPLGAHVDHQDGLVTGMTLDQAILLAFVHRGDRHICVESVNFPGRVEFALGPVPPRAPQDWGNYVRGAALALQQRYDLRVGIDAVVEGRMPIGGLSSSAAVSIAYLLALETANGLNVTPAENILLDRYVENVYLGLNNGILDQSIILMSDRDHLTFLDCQSVEFAKYLMPADKGHFEILVVYSGVASSLACTDYNSRVAECQEAARMMLGWAKLPIPAQPRPRMVPEEVYAQLAPRLPEPLGRRARHFFTEVRRVRKGVAAWQAGDLDEMGRLINESGASSVYNYESGCPPLIALYEILSECPGVYGTRFSGGGFRGSCIGLVNPGYREEIAATVAARYPIAHPEMADRYSVHFCRPDGPARLWDESQYGLRSGPICGWPKSTPPAPSANPHFALPQRNGRWRRESALRLERRGQLSRIVECDKELRPDIEWPVVPETVEVLPFFIGGSAGLTTRSSPIPSQTTPFLCPLVGFQSNSQLQTAPLSDR